MMTMSMMMIEHTKSDDTWCVSRCLYTWDFDDNYDDYCTILGGYLGVFVFRISLIIIIIINDNDVDY